MPCVKSSITKVAESALRVKIMPGWVRAIAFEFPLNQH